MNKKVALTEKQMEAIKAIVEFSEIFADQMHQIMVNHGLDKIEGCHIDINVTPEFAFTTRTIHLGRLNSPFGRLLMQRGVYDAEYVCEESDSSEEYQRLFANESIRSRERASKQVEKPLPPDGLWISIHDGDPYVDGGM